MPTFIKTGYWERASKSLKGWLNVDNLVRDIASSVVSTDEIGAIKGANSPSPTNPFATMNDIGGGGNTCADFIQSNTSAYTVVCTNDSPTDNGTALLAAYAAAKALTPNGSALSATNRASVIIPPGVYDLGSGEGYTPLTLDTEFVDLIGLTSDRESQHIKGTPPATNSGVIVQTANNVHISNLTVEILTVVEQANFGNTDSAAYFPSTNLSNTVIDNCEFIGGDLGEDALFTMRMAIEYSGTYNSCTGGDYAFGSGGTLSGKLYYCRLTTGSFQTLSEGGKLRACVDGSDTFIATLDYEAP